MAELTLTSAQRALGFVAARHRGDLEGAEALLGSFETEQERLLAVAFVLELCVSLLAAVNDETFDDTVQSLSLSMAQIGNPQIA